MFFLVLLNAHTVVKTFVSFHKEMDSKPELKPIMALTEKKRLRVAADLVEAVYYLHNLTKVCTTKDSMKLHKSPSGNIRVPLN